MAGDDDDAMKDEQLQDMQTQINGLATDIMTMHERMDSTITTVTERFDQLDLAQTATKTTLDTIVSRLDALNTMVTEFQ
jgi:flagellar capping protein FliD